MPSSTGTSSGRRLGHISGNASSGVYAYDPSPTRWAQRADLTDGHQCGQSTAVLDGQLYVVGGCTTGDCAPTEERQVYRYDPAGDSWTAVADYPEKVAFTACAGIAGEVVCAGGVNADTNASTRARLRLRPRQRQLDPGGRHAGRPDWAMARAVPATSCRWPAGSWTTAPR